MSEKVIEIKNLVKEYPIYTSNMQKLKGLLFDKSPSMIKTAVSGITADVYKGESIAIVGNVAAGRSTLMKLISGIIYPTSGSVKTNGSIRTIFDLRSGFDNELTGRENLYVRGVLVGLSKQQIKEKEQEIIEFAELEEIIDLPMRAWKAGFSARLSLSIAFAYKTDILLIDDPMSVRDKIFQNKVKEKLREIVSDGETTLLIVTNQLSLARRVCKRAWFIDSGNIIFDGKPAEAMALYKEYAKNYSREAPETDPDTVEVENDFGDDEDDGM